jgi:hypothetical protein
VNTKTKLLVILAAGTAAYRYAGVGGLILLAFLALLAWLMRARRFATCPSCGGLGVLHRRLGSVKTCRACKGTGLRKRSQRRKARAILGDTGRRGLR